MADNDPWLYSPALGLRFGPFTASDKDRKAADDRWEELKKLSARQKTEDRDTRDRSAYPGPMRDPRYVKPQPGSVDAWGYPVDPMTPPTDGPPIGIGTILNGIDKISPAGIAGRIVGGYNALVTPQHGPPDNVGAPGSVSYYPNGDEPDVAPNAPPPEMANTETPPDAAKPQTATPEGQSAAPQDEMSSLEDYLKMIDKFYPARPTQNPYQAQADAYLAKEAERTRLLAQLALAAGLTAQGGPAFEGMSKGFAAAANVYGEGFARYQTALQDSADRYAKQRDEDYSTSIAKHDAAVKLYTSSREDARTRAEKRDKEQERIGKLFQNEFDLIKGGEDGLGADPAKFAEWQKRYQLWLKTGEYIPPLEDVSDG